MVLYVASYLEGGLEAIVDGGVGMGDGGRRRRGG